MTGILCFFGLFVFGPFYDHLLGQGGVFLFVFLWSSIRFSFSATFSLLKFALPFVISLSVFGFLFHLARLLGREDWLYDTLIKCLIFPSSLIFLKTILSYITYLDILQLPFSMKFRIDLVTIKSAFQKGSRALERFSWYLIPILI